MGKKLYFMISGSIFALVAVMHLVPSLNSWIFQIGPYELLPWMSYLGFVLAGALSIWAFRLATK